MLRNEKKYELTPEFCRFNKIAVKSMKDKCLSFVMSNVNDEKLKSKICRSVKNYYGSDFWKCNFIEGNREEINRLILNNFGRSKEKSSGGETAVFLDRIIADGISCGATDIHIEANRIRYRIDGRLKNENMLSFEKSQELVRIVKVRAGMDIMDGGKGQDGQFVFEGERKAFIRCSCIPVAGDCPDLFCSAVLRILDPERIPFDLAVLGFNESQQSVLKQIIKKKSGLVLICGPTGSGKSTTAASLLEMLKKEEGQGKKIITVEDPPEFILDGITQIKVDENRSLSFENALKFIFRQDPDVIFIGEIRDSLSAATALRAALTGHLVISTVHTDGFIETFMRLTELGCELNYLSRIVRGIVQQQLERGEDNVKLEAKVLEIGEELSQLINAKGFSFEVKRILEERQI